MAILLNNGIAFGNTDWNSTISNGRPITLRWNETVHDGTLFLGRAAFQADGSVKTERVEVVADSLDSSSYTWTPKSLASDLYFLGLDDKVQQAFSPLWKAAAAVKPSITADPAPSPPPSSSIVEPSRGNGNTGGGGGDNSNLSSHIGVAVAIAAAALGLGVLVLIAYREHRKKRRAERQADARLPTEDNLSTCETIRPSRLEELPTTAGPATVRAHQLPVAPGRPGRGGVAEWRLAMPWSGRRFLGKTWQ